MATQAAEGEVVRILVVDDDRLIRRIMVDGLTDEGASCFEASSGSEAIQAAAQFRPDVCILDQNLPDMDGLSVLAAIKALPLQPMTRVYLLTGSEDESLSAKAKGAGASGVIRKPCTPADVMRLIMER